MSDLFARFAHHIAQLAGSAYLFVCAVLIIVVWGVSGPIFGFSDTWQLVINTGTTIITFLMVFLIQNTQNRDAAAMQLKLDELIHAMSGARDTLIDMEEASGKRLELMQKTYRRLGQEARHDTGEGQ